MASSRDLSTSDGWTTPFGTAPAASVITEFLRTQSGVPARSPLARFFGRSPLSAESRPWYIGALGELDVAARLARLGEGWTVVHSVPIGERGADIDHVVVGPAGVFTINTKLHEDARVWVGSRRMLVNGQKTDHLRNARFEANRVAAKLSDLVGTNVPVTPLIVIVAARQITVREKPADVHVLRETGIARWLARRPSTLDPQHSERLGALVSDASTWSSDATAPVDLEGFDDLRKKVNVAKRTRLLWATGAFLLFAAAAGAVALNSFASMFA